MPVKFVGRESHFYGKTLFEIARNLKNFGVGRVVMRTKYNKQYPDEVTYYRLTKVEPDMNSKVMCIGTSTKVLLHVLTVLTTQNLWKIVQRNCEAAWRVKLIKGFPC